MTETAVKRRLVADRDRTFDCSAELAQEMADAMLYRAQEIVFTRYGVPFEWVEV